MAYRGDTVPSTKARSTTSSTTNKSHPAVELNDVESNQCVEKLVNNIQQYVAFKVGHPISDS